ncbi:hypothetical protein LCGC14_1376430 [marine sediment metagenome]|uniref:Uncharacterized protein n=1 Tax=marine sediment metagenome TaxID=412755 RepID=A0A0F9MJ97_9ZZZZ
MIKIILFFLFSLNKSKLFDYKNRDLTLNLVNIKKKDL